MEDLVRNAVFVPCISYFFLGFILVQCASEVRESRTSLKRRLLFMRFVTSCIACSFTQVIVCINLPDS